MDYYTVAAKWWADKIRMNRINSKRKSINSFEHRLSVLIKEHVEEHGSMTLSTNHVPDLTLHNLAKETHINDKEFPCKATMHILIDGSIISVKDGYGSSFESIFPC